MKNLTILSLSLLALSSSAALAGPKVGDFAKMEGTMVENRQSVPLTVVQKITAFDGTLYTVEQTRTIASETDVSSANYTLGELVTAETAAQIVSECEKGLGKLEKVKTKAGIFQTCRTESSGAKVWMAVAPFGVVKISMKTPAGKIEISLTEFGYGN